LTWLAAGVVPGVWLVLSGWSPELVPDRAGRAAATGECRALALALVADEEGARRRPAFRIVVDPGAKPAMSPAPVDLVGLAESLATPGGPAPRTIATDARGRLRVELQGGQAIQLDAIGSALDSQSVGLSGLTRSAPQRIPRGVRRVG
jgi:hypothetical protein